MTAAYIFILTVSLINHHGCTTTVWSLDENSKVGHYKTVIPKESKHRPSNSQHSQVPETINFVLNLSAVVSDLPHFWSSTGFCPPYPHRDACSWFISPDMIQNLAYIGAVPHDGISNVRVHYLLDAIRVKSFRYGRPVYDFSCLDSFIKLLHDNGLHPGFEIMGNPSGLFNDFENRTQIYMWRDLILTLATHYIGKYGLDYVSKWNFESWNEPHPKMFDGLNFTQQGFLNYYDASSEGLRLASTKLRLGAPSGGCKNNYKPSNFCWLLLDHLNNGTNYFTGKKDIRVDFISIHEKGKPPYNSRVILDKEMAFHQLLRKHQPRMTDIPVYNDEADPLVTWSRPLSWRADVTYSSMIAKIIFLHQKLYVANRSSPFNFRLLSNDNGFLSYQPHPFSQRTLLARFQVNTTGRSYVQFIRKPGYSVMGLLALLGSKQIQTISSHPYVVNDVVNVLASVHTPITDKQSSSWQMAALFYYSTDTWRQQTTTKLEYLREVVIKVNITGMLAWKNASKEVIYVIYALDRFHGNPYSIWTSHDCPATPSSDLLRKMRANQDPVRISGPVPITHDGTLSVSLDLGHSGVMLLHGCSKSELPPSQTNGMQNEWLEECDENLKDVWRILLSLAIKSLIGDIMTLSKFTLKESPESFQVENVRLYNITYNQLLIVWSDSSVRTNCILNYDVEYSPSGSRGTFYRINSIDSIFTIYVYAPSQLPGRPLDGEVVRGYYRVRAVDYWQRPGKYSATVKY